MLPKELRDAIKPVLKLSNNVGVTRNVSALSELAAKLWLPSMTELCGEQPPNTFSKEYQWLSPLYNKEGKEYQLYRELKVSPCTNNKRMVRTWSGKKACWWERTVSPDTSEGEGRLCINRVGADGNVYSHATPARKPAEKTCVIPGFCI